VDHRPSCGILSMSLLPCEGPWVWASPLLAESACLLQRSCEDYGGEGRVERCDLELSWAIATGLVWLTLIKVGSGVQLSDKVLT
jgi:hypothetical protein